MICVISGGYLTYEKVNNNIIFKLINKDKNEALLKEVPYCDYMDLAVVFYLFLPEYTTDKGMATVPVTNEMLEEWRVETEDLMVRALENTPRLLGLQIRGILTTIASYIGDKELEDIARTEDEYNPLYVATNNLKNNGAAVILYKDMLRAFSARKKSDIYVIPCSIHEVILLTSQDCIGMDVEELKKMIHTVNETELTEDDILSDSLYFYSRENDKLSLVS